MADQTQSNNLYGPFSDALTSPLVPQQEQIKIGGAPSKGAALASFANSFLIGAAKGQMSKYERSERDKYEQERNFDSVYQHISASPNISPEGKKIAEQQYLQAKYSKVNEAANSAEKEHKDNPLLGLVKSISGAVLGPASNKKHKDLGIDVNSLLNIANDPKYRIDPTVSSAAALSNVLGNGQTQQSAVQQPQTAPAQQPTPAQGYLANKYPSATPTPPPPGTAAAALQGQSAPQNQVEAWNNPKFQAEVKKATQEGRDWTQEPLGQWFNSLPKAAAAKPAGAAQTIKDPNDPTGKRMIRVQGYFDPNTQKTTYETIGEAAATSGTRPVLGTSRVTLDNAKALASKGAVYNIYDDDGNRIKLEDLPSGMQLQPVEDSTHGSYYKAVSPNQVLTIVGNEVYTSTAQDRANIGQNGGNGVTDLGIKNPGTQTTHEVPVVINGQPAAMQMHGGSTPNTTGAKNRPAPPGTPQTAAPVSQQRPAVPGVTVKPSAAQGQAPARTQSQALPPGTRALPGVATATWEKEQPKILTVKEAAAPLFGSADDPNIKGLADFGDLLEKPEAIEPLKTALQYTFDQLDNNSGHSSGSGFSDWMANSAGWTAAKADAESNVKQNIFNQISDPSLRDQVMQAYDATMTAFGTAVGLRKLTGASAAKFSVKAIENELPVLGVNTFNQQDLFDRLSRLAVQVKNGANSTVDTAWNAKGERDKYLNYDKQMQARKQNAPDPSKTSITTKSGKISIGDSIKLKDGTTHKVKAFTAAGGIIPE